MAYIHSIYKDIALILDHNYDHDLLSQKLSDGNYDWELLVKVGSKQLVLPTIYCNLKRKELLHHLPKDLQTYLHEITSLNRNRNKTILEEATGIAELLQANQIDYAFLKGTALLLAGYYKDIGERMIGDVDILVHPDQLAKTQEIMVQNGYKEVETTFGQNFFEHKHLARLIPDTKLAAVEVHRKLLHKKIKNTLLPLSVLQNKQVYNDIAIGCDEDLLVHAVLNFQINDYGSYFNYLGLRNAYDVLILLDKVQKPQLDKLLSQKYINSFFDKMHVYFNLEMDRKNSLVTSMGTHFFILKQTYGFFGKTSYLMLRIIQNMGIIANRVWVFLGNPEYRKESLKDHKRVLRLLKKLLNPF